MNKYLDKIAAYTDKVLHSTTRFGGFLQSDAALDRRMFYGFYRHGPNEVHRAGLGQLPVTDSMAEYLSNVPHPLKDDHVDLRTKPKAKVTPEADQSLRELMEDIKRDKEEFEREQKMLASHNAHAAGPLNPALETLDTTSGRTMGQVLRDSDKAVAQSAKTFKRNVSAPLSGKTKAGIAAASLLAGGALGYGIYKARQHGQEKKASPVTGNKYLDYVLE